MSRDNDDRSARTAEEIRVGWKMAGIGFEVASEVAAGALIGWVIDLIFDTGTTWTAIGAIAGIGVGLFSLIRGTLKLNRQLDRDEQRRKAKGNTRSSSGDGSDRKGS